MQGLRAAIFDPGNRYLHSENRGALAIYDSAAVSITGLTLANSGGDGLYLENTNDTSVARLNCTRNFRQGMRCDRSTDRTIDRPTL
eukprot:SAG22_NODE_2423_length_2590_cov_1.917302_3_plen_86_part_00